MARMTEEEANALDEEITNTDITLVPGKGGIFTRQRELLEALDSAPTSNNSVRENVPGLSLNRGKMVSR